MGNIKLIFYGIVTAIIITVLGFLFYYKNKVKILETEYSNTIELVKAYESENDSLRDNSNIYKLTISQLEYSKDSITQSLNNVRKTLKIKDKELKSLQYIYSQSLRKDTIILRDTIFRDSSLNLDTLIYDEWYSLKLGLKYPSTIEVSPSFNNKQYVTVSLKKEYTKPPHKCFLVRWFQKKHTVATVTVIEQNPYTSVKEQRFVEIIK